MKSGLLSASWVDFARDWAAVQKFLGNIKSCDNQALLPVSSLAGLRLLGSACSQLAVSRLTVDSCDCDRSGTLLAYST